MKPVIGLLEKSQVTPSSEGLGGMSLYMFLDRTITCRSLMHSTSCSLEPLWDIKSLFAVTMRVSFENITACPRERYFGELESAFFVVCVCCFSISADKSDPI